MKTIVIIIGLTASQIQDRSNVNLDIARLYDIDARYFQGPITVRYEIGRRIIDLPEAELVSLSFELGVLIYANVTPHLRPLDGAESAKLCRDLERALLHGGFLFRGNDAKEFQKFVASLQAGHVPAEPPPWAFGFNLGEEGVNLVVRPFEGWSEPVSGSDGKRFLIELALHSEEDSPSNVAFKLSSRYPALSPQGVTRTVFDNRKLCCL